MKLKLYSFIVICLFGFNSFSQIRPDIYSFTSAQRSELADLIIDFVDTDILQMHCDYSTLMNDNNYDIHDDFNFLPFHRMYLEKLEDWLLEQGYPQYVPLPKWTGFQNPPDEFRTAGPNGDGVSPYCGTTSCADAQFGTCAQAPLSVWQNHTVTMPQYITLSPSSGNSLCDWNFTPAVFTQVNDESGSNGLSRKIETPWHNSGHTGFGNSVMTNFKSPAAAVFWIWHAAVDDKWKEWECNCPQSTTLPYDLYMKDNDRVVSHYRDRGEEPNQDPGAMWISKDIWVRQQNDGLSNHNHENPEYSAQDPNFVYVQIRNRGCVASPAGETLELYWAKAATALAWPNYWNGSIQTSNGTDISGLVGTVTLPAIGPGESFIAEFPWMVPNPNDYVGLGSDPVFWADQPHHFCLSAKFESSNDPLIVSTTSMQDFTKQNNNVAWKNISVVDLDPNNIAGDGTTWEDIKIKPGANILVGDATGNGGVYDLQFTIPDIIKGNPITDEAEIRVKLDTPLWIKWQNTNFQGIKVDKLRPNEHEIIISEGNAVIKNIPFAPNERFLVNVRFNFLTKELSGQEFFEYDVNQLDANTGAIIGGERFEVHVPVRDLFFADAGPDQEILMGKSAQLNAFEINEEVSYKWFSPDGKLLFTGKDITVSPQITTEYKLEVMAKLDGAVDYDDVTVKIKPYSITSVAPNPVKDYMQIQYMTQGASSAYLMITAPYGNTYNQILDPNQTTQTINTSQWSRGYYVVVLVCNGENMDTVNLLVE